MKEPILIAALCLVAFLSEVMKPTPALPQEAQPTIKKLPVDGLKRIPEEQNLSKEFVRGMGLVRSRYSSDTPYGVMVAVSPHPVRDGEASLRLELRAGDCGKAGVGGRYPADDCKSRKDRIELRSQISAIKRNTRGQYGWSLYLPEDFELNDPEPPDTYLVQFHELSEDPNVKYPTPFALGYGKGKASPFGAVPGLVIRRSVDLDPAYDDWHERTAILEEELRGRWHDFRVDAYWRSKKDGYFRLYVDDKLVYDFSGPTIQGRNGFLRLGFYRFNVVIGRSPTVVMYLDKIWRK